MIFILARTKVSLALTLGLFLILCFSIAARAATYTVTNTADSGAGSFRQAVMSANATADDDTISFNIPATDTNCNASGVCTVRLTSGEIRIKSATGASGNLLVYNQTGASRLRISGNNQSRVIFIDSIPFENNNTSVTFQGLTLTEGNGVGAVVPNVGSNYGGAVASRGGLLIFNNSVISNSSTPPFARGGGIASYGGEVQFIDSTISGNTSGAEGGGIYISSDLRMYRSTVSGNRARNGGGGIYNDSQLRPNYIFNSTISGNTVSDTADYNAAYGGGIYDRGQSFINNSTVTNNLAVSVFPNGDISGGGVYMPQGSTQSRWRNSIIAGNNAANHPDIGGNQNLGIYFVSSGSNLIGSSNTSAAIGWQSTDLVNPAGGAGLAPLADNGGATQTHALSPNSPAVNAGDNCVTAQYGCGFSQPVLPVTTDQRGVPRPGTAANRVDIGAFEVASAGGRAPFDFDGDNKTDLSIYRPSAGEWWYLKSSTGGNGAFQFGTSTDKLVPADYTGDGKTDIAFFRPASGEWFVLRSEDSSFYSFPFGAGGDLPQVGDFDADGKSDATVYRPSTSQWFTRRSTDGGATIQGFGQAGDVPVVADYDGDDKADIAIYRPSSGEWWIRRSAAGEIAFQFGNPADKPVRGDYTGDGKADVAFWRPSTGEWFVLRSENLSFYSFPFGSSGDLPAPGDYDGDGKFDAAVFRPSNNTWYAQRATAGTLIQGFGQNGDKPVPNAFVP